MNKDEHRAWRSAVFHADLPPGQRLVLLALETFTDYPAGTNAYPGIEKLAEMCGCDERTVRRALKRGVKLGLIEKTGEGNRRLGKADVYRIITGQQCPVIPVITGQQCPVIGEDQGTVQTGSQDSAVTDQGTVVSTHQSLVPIPSTKEKPSPSLRSGDGKDFPRSQAHAQINEIKSRTEIYRLAQKIVGDHVHHSLRTEHTRFGFYRDVQDALERGLDENKIRAAVQEWNVTAVRDWDARIPGRTSKTFEVMLKSLANSKPVTATGAHQPELRRP